MLAGRGAMFRDPGTFWHVAAGEKMLAAGEVVRQDPFSFTRAAQPWVADQWLAECGMAAVHRLAGWDGLLLLTAALLAGFYAWIAVRLLRGGLHVLPACLLPALAMLIAAPQFHVRPLVCSIVLLGIAFAWLVDVESGVKRPRHLWWLVPLFIVWANVHGGVLGGLGTVALCVAGWLVFGVGAACRSGNAAACRFRNSVELLLLLPALAATTLINPYGIDLPWQWLTTLTMPLPGLIEEHAPLDLTKPLGWATVALAAGYAVVLIGVFPRRPRITWLIPLVWFVLAIARCRNASLFAVTAAVALADVLPYSRVGEWLRRCGMLGAVRQAVGWRPAVLPLIVVAAAMAIQIGGVNLPVVGRGWVQFDRDRRPVELLPRLDEIGRSNKDGVRVFNDMNFGGFLIYHQPRMRVFIDDRCTLYGTDFLQAYDHARREDPAQIDRWQRRYGFHHALVETGGNFDRHLRSSAAWIILGRAPAATLYQHRLGVSAPVR
ncbi:MAG: hypothetical protein KKA28_16175 [Planctomycetes bacterium]|nr:hypothetical protein [Planctomycetota bacterium]MCG2682076.1 hypothetical protein [Planctomycetales bacterium]